MLEYLNGEFGFGYVEIVIFLVAVALVLRAWLGERGDTFLGFHFDASGRDGDGGDCGGGDGGGD